MGWSRNQTLPKSADDHRATQLHHVRGRHPIFRWIALAGAFRPYVGGSTPRNYSPCGICLDRNEPILLSHPYRVFEYFNDASPAIIEGLVLPLRGETGHALGTIWIVSHEEGRGFDQGILETMTRLADFTVLALRVAESAADKDRLLHSAQREIVERKRAEQTLRESEANLRLALKVGQLGSWQLDLSTGCLSASEKCKANFGYSPDQPFGYEELRAAIHSEDRDRQQQVVANAAEAKSSFEIEYRAITPSRELRWIDVRGRYDGGSPEPRLIGVSQDITERKRDEQRMIGQRHVLEMVASGAPLQDTLDELMRFIEAQEFGARCGILIVTDDGHHFRRGAGPNLPETYHDALDGVPITPPYLGSCGEAANACTSILVPDVASETRYANQWRDMLLACGMKAVRSTPVRGSDGRVLASIAIYYDHPRDPNPADPQLIDIATHLAAIAIERDRDLSAQAAARERQKLLIDELNHRVKNTLATVQSFASQTLRNSNSLAEARSMFDSRLLSLAKAHDVLTKQSWEGADLREVVDQALDAHRTAKGRITIKGPDVRLSPKQALALSMALHELATNAAKYGALSNDSGRVQVGWHVRRNGGADELDLGWTEEGGPLVTPPTRKGFGSRLIERNLANELAGEVRIDYRPAGVAASIRTPVEFAGERFRSAI